MFKATISSVQFTDNGQDISIELSSDFPTIQAAANFACVALAFVSGGSLLLPNTIGGIGEVDDDS